MLFSPLFPDFAIFGYHLWLFDMPQLWLPDNSPSTYSNLIEADIPKVQLSEFPVAKANLTCTFCLLIEVWDFLP